MSTRCLRFPSLGLLGLLSLGLPGCGGSGGGGTTPTPVTQPPAPVRTTISQGSGTLDAPTSTTYYFGVVPFSTSATGTIDVRVDWTFATNTVWVFLTQSACTAEQFQHVDCPGGPSCPCPMAVSSMTSTPKPRMLSLPNATAGSRSLIIANFGPREESVTYEITLTR